MTTLLVPPYRAALLTGSDGAPLLNAPDGSALTTEKQWYMFWSDLSSQVNANTRLGGQFSIDLQGMITFGLHADRPDVAAVPSGALYIETDRGASIYQNHNVGWQYLAGTMYGTLSPDQRPTDLGPAGDAGFVFKTNVDPAQTFVWDGGEWIETTPTRYGTHAQRLAVVLAEIVSGMLWVETDRGDVLYQNQGGTWQYLTGTMYGTLSPDQRPTDLTAAQDAGFIFKTNVQPAQSFTWNGGQWVETTPVRYGTHAARLAATIANLVSGMLWVETDRGDVFYQNQGGTWQYLTGTMYGTLSPDQRPTDLTGVPDAGFTFKTNTDPARAFGWSGGRWIETTPIRYGTHAERLAAVVADLVSGMLWMETDRGSVIYQNQGGIWLYLAGTMWDTMSPDHRPTDLGLHDAGFDYRSTDPPPREFVWNQTAWVETTPALPGLVQLAYASVNQTLTTGAADVAGAALTLTRAGRHLILASVSFSGGGAGDANAVGLGQLVAGGVVQPGFAIFAPLVIAGTGVTPNPTTGWGTAFAQWSYFAATAGVIVKLQAFKNSGTGASQVATQTNISATWISP